MAEEFHTAAFEALEEVELFAGGREPDVDVGLWFADFFGDFLDGEADVSGGMKEAGDFLLENAAWCFRAAATGGFSCFAAATTPGRGLAEDVLDG